MSAPAKLLVHLVTEASQRVFAGLTDVAIMTLFKHDDEKVRKVAALKCVQALPKARVARLLNGYVSGEEYRYYNVIHWLDLGASAPRGRALAAAEKVLKALA